MPLYILVLMFGFCGAFLGAAAGWVTGVIYNELETRGQSLNKFLSYCSGMTIGMGAAVLCAFAMGAWGLLAILAAIPAAGVARLMLHIADTAPEMEPLRPDPPKDQAKDQAEVRALFLVIIAFVTSISAGVITHFFGWGGGLLAITAGAIVASIITVGIPCIFYLAIVPVMVGLPRLAKRLASLGVRISRAITSD